jgi:hypothetical protein
MEGIPTPQIKESISVPSEALLLKREFALAVDSVWNNNNVYPVVAVKFGRGFLVYIDTSLDEEESTKCWSINFLIRCETLAKSYTLCSVLSYLCILI